jgi:hypothetical protein
VLATNFVSCRDLDELPFCLRHLRIGTIAHPIVVDADVFPFLAVTIDGRLEVSGAAIRKIGDRGGEVTGKRRLLDRRGERRSVSSPVKQPKIRVDKAQPVEFASR